VDANLLIDFSRGEVLTQIPFLSICTLERMNQTLNLTEEFSKAFDRAANLTTYLGEISPAWDQLTPLYKFSSKEQVDSVDYKAEGYFEKATKALKWVSYADNQLNKQFVVALGKGGLLPATFTDADFKLSGCNPQVAAAQLIAKKALPESNEPVDLKEEARKAADEANAAAEKAMEAAKIARKAAIKALEALKNIENPPVVVEEVPEKEHTHHHHHSRKFFN